MQLSEGSRSEEHSVSVEQREAVTTLPGKVEKVIHPHPRTGEGADLARGCRSLVSRDHLRG